MTIQEEKLLKAYVFIRDELSSVYKSRQEKKSRSLVKSHLSLWCTNAKGDTQFKDIYSEKVKGGDT